MKGILFVFFFYFLLKAIVEASTLVSGELGLWSLSNSRLEKLGNCNVKSFFRICEDQIYWIDENTVFRGSIYGNETEAMTRQFENDCIRSFDVDCSASKLLILNICEKKLDELNTHTKEMKTLLSGLASPNRLVLDSAHKRLYLLYDFYIERYNESLANKIMPKPDKLQPTNKLQPMALTIYNETAYIAFQKINQFYILKCDLNLNFTACSNITQGKGYIQNVAIDQDKLFIVKSTSSTIDEWSLSNNRFTNHYVLKDARDIQLSSSERLLPCRWIFTIAVVTTLRLLR